MIWTRRRLCFAAVPGSVAILAAALAGCGVKSAPPRPGGERPNILLILIDTLRADHLSIYGYTRQTSPAIDALAQGGIVFERAYAQAPFTPPSVASLLTSTYPSTHGVTYPPSAKSTFRPIPESLVTLPEALADAGYHTMAVSSHPWIQPQFGYGRGFEVFERVPPGAYAEKRFDEARLVVDKALEVLSQPPPGPFFLYLHMMGPHWPYTPGPDDDFNPPDRQPTPLIRQLDALPARWMQGFDLIRQQARNGALSGADLEILKARYDGLIRATDAALAKLFDRLRERRWLEDTVVVLTSDHGEEFMEHDQVFHNSLFNEVLRVPLIFIHPPTYPRRQSSGALAEAIDVPATLLALAGADRPGSFQGRDLFSDGRKRLVVAEHAEEVKVQSRRWSVIRSTRDPVRAFDLDRDPGEREDRSSQHPELTREMLDRLNQILRPTVPAERQLVIDDQTRDQLLALGYLDADRHPDLLSADPDPIIVCDGSGLGTTTLTWNVPAAKPPIEIRVNAPDGKLMARSTTSGSAPTGKWVRDGTTFFLLEAESGKVLAELRARVTRTGCDPP